MVMRVNLQLLNKTPACDSLRLQEIIGKAMQGDVVQIEGNESEPEAA